MSDIAIKLEGLSKQYRIGAVQTRYKTLRESLSQAVSLTLMRLVKSKPGEENPNSIWALRDVSFEVKKGEVVGIIGRNGAGKSTLLKLLSHITEPTRGRVELHGRVGSLLEVGTGFHPELTGRENIYLNGAILGMIREEINRKFDEIVDFAEVEKFLDTPVKRYSSGMYMRLAFAVAAHLEPEILLVDEVLSVGDSEFQKKCLGKMGEISKQGRTVVLVSHNMNTIEQLCTRALLFDKGILISNNQNVRGVVVKYLFGNSNGNLISEWVNSGQQYINPYFKPLRFFFVDEYGYKKPLPMKNDETVWLQIDCEINLIDSGLQVGYGIYSDDGHLLYRSYSTDAPERKWPKLKLGRNILRVKIPPRLLNEGSYQIELLSTLYNREWILQPGQNTPNIWMSIQGGLSNSPLWVNKRAGFLAPELEWQCI